MTQSSAITLQQVLTQARACKVCEPELPCGARPVIQASPEAELLIIGQAPGLKVHKTGVPWNDPSGDRLRDWLKLSKDTFYNPKKVAIVPMGFCYPGKGRSGDLPPRKECAPLWHQALLSQLPNIKLTLLIGQYAQNHYLSDKPATLTETVRDATHWLEHQQFPLPHPSPRNQIWLKRNPWFEEQTLPLLRDQLKVLNL